MDIQVRTDYHVRGDEELAAYIGGEVEDGLRPYVDRVMSVHAFLTEENGARKGPLDLRVLLEVRPCGHSPLAVVHRAATKDEAVRGAVNDMRGVLDRIFRRMDSRRATATIRHRTA